MCADIVRSRHGAPVSYCAAPIPFAFASRHDPHAASGGIHDYVNRVRLCKVLGCIIGLTNDGTHMAHYARKATLAASIDELRPAPGETAALTDVLRHWRAFARMTEALQDDAPLATILDEAAKCAALGCNAPMSKVLEVEGDGDTLVVRGQYGMGADVIGRSAGAVQAWNPAGEALTNAKPVVERDVRLRPQDKVPAILIEHQVVTSVNLPLINRSGAYGILEVDFREPTHIGALEMSFLASVASALSESIEKYRTRSMLTADRDAKVDLLREQQHRIRNNFQLIVAMLQRNGALAKDPHVRDSFKQVERRVFAMASLYNHLLGLGDHGELVDLGRYLASMADSFHDFYGLRESGITLEINLVSGISVTLDTCTAIGTVVNELVANAVEHAFAGTSGQLTISLTRNPSGGYTICVADNGRGLLPSALEHIGLRTSRRILSSIGGQLHHRSQPAPGTAWDLTLPE